MGLSFAELLDCADQDSEFVDKHSMFEPRDASEIAISDSSRLSFVVKFGCGLTFEQRIISTQLDDFIACQLLWRILHLDKRSLTSSQAAYCIYQKQMLMNVRIFKRKIKIPEIH